MPNSRRGTAAATEPDTAWFEALFADNYDDLLRYAARRVGRDAASDVVSDVFLIAWGRRGEYKLDGARLWLFGVARRVVSNAERSDARAARLIGRAACDPPDVVVDHADRIAVTSMSARSSRRCRPPSVKPCG